MHSIYCESEADEKKWRMKERIFDVALTWKSGISPANSPAHNSGFFFFFTYISIIIIKRPL